MEAMDDRQEKPHDVLAAEEFGIGTRDDRFPPDPTGEQEAHDVLAAEEFAMPSRDDRFPHDPSGIQEPHDVLAAEEFAMPAGGEVTGGGGFNPWTFVPPLVLVALIAAVLLRRRG